MPGRALRIMYGYSGGCSGAHDPGRRASVAAPGRVCSRARTTALLAGCFLVLAGVACGRRALADPPDACSLIPPAAASKILKTSVSAKPVINAAARQMGASLCDYKTTQMHGGFMIIAGRIRYHDARKEAAGQQRLMRENPPPPGIPPMIFAGNLPHLGEAAWLVKGPGSSFQIHVLAHGVSLVISMNRDATPARIAQVRRLAETALDHLR